jgi:hypothetical protein
MRQHVVFLGCGLLLPAALLGCADSHGVVTDSGPLADAPFVVDAHVGGMCPAGINPWNPSDPLSACSPEGSTCTSGSGDACGSFMSCTCEMGRWNCAVAEADPVCWCGRQPSEGDRCNEEGMSCGECCPTPGGTGWPAMQCSGGHWTAAACPATTCPPVMVPECPAATRALIGTACSFEGQDCGDPCCSSSITCSGGTWQVGPEADCFACLEYACGEGACRTDQTCTGRCGPADGVVYTCVDRDPSCDDCSCLPPSSLTTCEMIDGHPHVSEVGFCG